MVDEVQIAELPPLSGRAPGVADSEALFQLTQWQLMWRKFKRHKVALVGGYVLVFVYLLAILGQFFSPYRLEYREPRADAR